MVRKGARSAWRAKTDRRARETSTRPLKLTVRRIAVVPSGALATILRFIFGAQAGAIFTLFVLGGAFPFFSVPTILVLVCVGAAIGAYLAFRYGDRFIAWVLRLWNQPGD